MKKLNPKIICKDGTTLSTQSSEYHYCLPRNDDGPYTHVEVGLIFKNGEQITPPETWREYAGCDFPSDVYGYVPIELVEEFINSHNVEQS